MLNPLLFTLAASRTAAIPSLFRCRGRRGGWFIRHRAFAAIIPNRDGGRDRHCHLRGDDQTQGRDAQKAEEIRVHVRYLSKG